MVLIRSEQGGDVRAIRDLTDRAFGTTAEESLIIERLRGSDRWIADLSLVAVGGRSVVGHCVSSVADLEGDDAVVGAVLALGPFSVEPSRQRHGIGAALMRATIQRATDARWPAIVLLGHPAYYQRFGFEPARPLGIEPPIAWPDDAWMVLRLADWRPYMRGRIRYPAAFGIA